MWSEGKNGIKNDLMMRVTKDSFMFYDVDTVTKKKKWGRFNEYYVPFVDTLRGKDGRPLPDSLGKFKLITRYYPFYPGAVIFDFNKNVDSLIKNYKPPF
jgi:hypothetical protein